MYDSPSSLQEVCVDFICENLDILCETTVFDKTIPSAVDESEICEEQKQCHKITSSGTKIGFKDSDVYFHSEISENLLTSLCAKGKLTDVTMTLFDVSTTRLR